MDGPLMTRLVGILLAAAALLSPVRAEAQSMVDLYSDLFTFGQCGEPLCLDVNAEIHGHHYVPSLVQGEDNLLAFVTGSVGATLGNLPFAAATGGVTFRFEGGAPVATSVSPGPIFSDRAQTLGAGRTVVGLNVSGVSFSSIRGTSLDDLRFRFTHVNVGSPVMGDPDFENDMIEVALDMDMELLVTSLFASYGVTEGLDVSVQVPVVRSSLEGRSEARLMHWEDESPHHFLSPSGDSVTVAQTSASGTSTGIGDVTLRMKASLVETENSGISMIADARLPTGAEEDFHGAGAAGFRVAGVVSHRIGNFSPHANLGVVMREGWNQTNSLVTTLGFDHMISDAATLVVEFMGDFQIEDSPLVLPDPVVFQSPFPTRTVEMTNIPDRTDHLLDVGFGFKFQAPGDTRIVTSAVLPFLEGGARPSFMWTVGLDRSF